MLGVKWTSAMVHMEFRSDFGLTQKSIMSFRKFPVKYWCWSNFAYKFQVSTLWCWPEEKKLTTLPTYRSKMMSWNRVVLSFFLGWSWKWSMIRCSFWCVRLVLACNLSRNRSLLHSHWIHKVFYVFLILFRFELHASTSLWFEHFSQHNIARVDSCWISIIQLGPELQFLCTHVHFDNDVYNSC